MTLRTSSATRRSVVSRSRVVLTTSATSRRSGSTSDGRRLDVAVLFTALILAAANSSAGILGKGSVSDRVARTTNGHKKKGEALAIPLLTAIHPLLIVGSADRGVLSNIGATYYVAREDKWCDRQRWWRPRIGPRLDQDVTFCDSSRRMDLKIA